MNGSQIYSGIIGFVMPYIVEFLKVKLPKTKGKWLGYVLAYGLSVLVGTGTAFFGGDLKAESVLASTGTALIISQGVYNLYFKPQKVDKKIEKLLK